MLSSFLRRAGSLAAAGCLAGCILFVPGGSDLGTSCTFLGSDTPCGACIAKSCQTAIDACCLSADCKKGMDALDTCGFTSLCDSLASSAPDIAVCAATSCPVCGAISLGDAGRARDGAAGSDAGPRFSTNCGSPDAYGCICSADGKGSANDVACDVPAVGGGICCADRGWPNASQTLCNCKPFTCEPGSNQFVDVRCALQDFHTGVKEGTSDKCCADPLVQECKCGPSDMGCDPANIVARCTVAVMGCRSDQTQVTSCSF